MSSNGWRPTTLGDEVEILTGFPFRSALYTNEPDGIPLVRGDNVVQGRFRWDDVKRWPSSDTHSVTDYYLQAGDVVLAMDRPWIEAGLKYARVSEHDLPCLLVQRVARLRAKETLDQAFLRYVIGSPAFTNHILGVQTGTAVPHISSKQIKEFKFLKPPLSEQRAIAETLGRLDEKIELNRRMNETLEATAQALFNSWFVDFDPVRAKAEGRQPFGMDADTAALFPSSFEEPRVPRGWGPGKLSELLSLSREGLTPSQYPDEIFNHFSLPAFDEKRWPKIEEGRAVMSNKLIVAPGSILLSKLNPHIPRVWLPSVENLYRSICSTEFMVVMPQAEPLREYLYCLFNSQPFRNTFGSLVTGTSNSHQRVKPHDVLEMNVTIPDNKCVQLFSDLTRPILNLAACNLAQTKTLAEVRDALLPKLLSGELRIPDGEIGEESQAGFDTFSAIEN